MPGDVMLSKAANRTQGHKNYGGRLTVGAEGVSFEPNFINRVLGGQGWSAPLSAISAVDVADREESGGLAGGLRRRLRIRLHNGHEELFVLNGVENVVAVIRAATHPGAGRDGEASPKRDEGQTAAGRFQISGSCPSHKAGSRAGRSQRWS